VVETTIKVNMLGGFTVCDENDRVVVSDQNSRSKKVLTLLEYLIFFRSREISQEEIIDLLWPDEEIDEPTNTLKTLLHRARASLDGINGGSGKNLIVCRRGVYSWNSLYRTVVDVEEFEKLCKLAETGTDSERLDYMLKALDLYKGDFLPKASGEMWVVSINTYYHSLYLKVAHEAVRLLREAGRHEEIINICQHAVTIDPFDEEMHLAMIRALIANNMQQAAMNHYNNVTELYMDKFGITPSSEMTALYKEIVKASNVPEMNLYVIRDELRESEKVDGAFYCEYEFFKDIYRLQARAAERTGSVVQIALISVKESGKKITQKQMTVIMQRLKDIISQYLRNSDIYCRYSVSQYLLMLQCASIEDSDRVLERIRDNFRLLYPHMNVMFHYTCLPMEPVA
jgi:DNA-binding SARP family transcriptional activator